MKKNDKTPTVTAQRQPRQIRFFEGYKKPITLALGFFDSIHVGHQKLISTAKEAAEKEGCENAIMTFDNNPLAFFGRGAPLVYNYDERVKILAEFSVDVVIRQTFDETFMRTSPEGFLNSLINMFELRHVVCGRDYTFGAKPQGNAETLKAFFEARNVPVTVVNDVLSSGVKASSTRVRELLLTGDITGANIILGTPYRISGLVERGHGVGNPMGFPTANIKSDRISTILKRGVYSVFCVIDGVRYEGVANAGTRPTFEENVYKVETNIIGFSGDLYGKELTVFFKDFIRDIKKFDSQAELQKQIAEDVKRAHDKQ